MRDTSAVKSMVEALLREKQSVVVAIDGYCGAGKSTFAKALQAQMGGNLFHMDDFFVPMQDKTPERLQTPGGNVDWERFLSEVLLPIKAGGAFAYRPFDCKTQALASPVAVTPHAINWVEGSYSQHPALRPYVDGTVFLTVAPDEQRRRILSRNGEAMLQRFVNEWIPLENTYFDAFLIREKADVVL